MRSRRLSIWMRSLTMRSSFDVAGVAQGIDGPDVRDRVVVEGAQNVSEGVDVAKVGEEGGLLQRLLADGGNVGVLDLRMHELARVEQLGKAVEAVVGNGGDADVGLARIGVAAVARYPPW